MIKKLLTAFVIATALVASFQAVTPPVANAQAAVGPPTAEEKAAQEAAAKKTPVKGNTVGETVEGPMGKAMMVVMGLFAWLLGVASITLDNAVFYTVVKMGDVVNDLAAVDVAWRILRDIGNIALIFGFLGIGISIILDTERLGYGKKMLPILLFAAVTLNFSLLVSEAVIDVGNLFATQFYTQINGGIPASAVSYDRVNEQGISNKLMSQLGLQTIYGDALNNGKVFDEGSEIVVAFMGIIVFLVTAFVMFSLAFILIARFVALVFLIIVAPIGFAGLAVPKLENTARQWWSMLFQQTITAPILLLMLYVALAVITDANFLTGFGLGDGVGDSAWTGTIDNGNLVGFASVMLSFAVAIGLLLMVTVLAKKLGAVGADYAMKMAGHATFGATAYLASAALGGSAYVARRRLQQHFPNSGAARVAARGLRLAESARMDVRAIPGVSAALRLGRADEAAGPIGRSALDRVSQGADWSTTSGQAADRQHQQETVLPRLNAAITNSLQTGDYRQASAILSSMSDRDFEERAAQRALIDNPVAAALLSQARFDKLMQSETISDATKTALAQARRDGDDPAHAQSRFNMGPATFGATLPSGAPHPFAGMTRGQALISGMNTTARGRLGGGILTVPPPPGSPPGTLPTARIAVLDLLNGADFDAIRRTGELSAEQQAVIGDYIEHTVTAPGAAGPRIVSLIAAAAAPAFRAYYNLP